MPMLQLCPLANTVALVYDHDYMELGADESLSHDVQYNLHYC
jgi:hypothetical protein